jgi:uncharacterized protein (TIGR00725 family)
MKTQHIIGIMGPGNGATAEDISMAYQLGASLAKHGYIVLTGGRAVGVMEAAMKGAKEEGGLTIGILPSDDNREQSVYVDIPIKTGMGSARNNINVLTADLVIAVGLGAGTTSEIALAIKANKPVFLLNCSDDSKSFFKSFAYPNLKFCSSPSQILNLIESILE